jgi:hypothetical protein
MNKILFGNCTDNKLVLYERTNPPNTGGYLPTIKPTLLRDKYAALMYKLIERKFTIVERGGPTPMHRSWVYFYM